MNKTVAKVLWLVCLVLFVILWLGAMARMAPAQQVIVCREFVRGETYVLTLNRDGTVTLDKASAVVTPGGTPGPKPPPDPAPSALRTIARDATLAVQDPAKKTNGPRVAAVYKFVSMHVDKVTSASEANDLLNRMLDVGVGSDVKNLWRPVALAVSGSMPAFSTTAYSQAYASISQGIEDGLGLPSSASRAADDDGKPGYINDRFWELLIFFLKFFFPQFFPPGQDLGMIDTHGGDALPWHGQPRRLNVAAAGRPGSPRTGGSQLISIPSLSGFQEGQATNLDTPSLRDGAPGGSARTKPPVRFNTNPALIRMWLDMQEAEQRRDAQPGNTQRISLRSEEWRPIAIAPRRSARACAT